MDQDRIVLIGCANSAGVAIDTLRRQGKDLPSHVEWVSVPCGGTIDELLLLRAFESGARGVLVLVCNDGACQSANGNVWAEKRISTARATLQEIGIEGWRLAFDHIAPNMPADILHLLTQFREPCQQQA